MRFMIIVKAKAGSGAGVMPPDALIAQSGALHEELACAGLRLDGHIWQLVHRAGMAPKE